MKHMKHVIPLLLILVGLASCSAPTQSEKADQRRDIDDSVRNAMAQLYRDVPGARDAASKAQGILVLPDVYKAAAGVGGEYGRGALLVGGRTQAYYSIASGSLGLQLGAQARNVVFMFMTRQALDDFRNSSGWQAGGTAGVTWVKSGTEGTVALSQMNAPVLAFVYGNTGLIADLSLAGAKISRLDL